ncbi:hypothetical protein N7481_009806 [Penicillium waksmanii]|uniref:uncharacterized protein n=1 Tax=Penicillium waksmanii TaxID=69791 RepID=UPI0025472CD2|nr:uncharacterized protein N7481_009806 [Penicillium waksmanii]KAJ5976099.1 hypothetical protein N7481_009806 [Penicillium waksmanii]
MILHGVSDNAREYGRLVSWEEEPKAVDWMAQRKQFLPGEGLIILEVQDDDFPILAEPPLKTDQEINGFESLGVMVAEAPYRVPAKLDLSQIESLLSARASAADDHLWALREDSEYFSHVVL